MNASPRIFSVMLVFAVLAIGPVARAQDDQQQHYQTLAKSLLERGGVNRGVASVIGANAPLVLELARQSELLIHVREANATAVADLKSKGIFAFSAEITEAKVNATASRPPALTTSHCPPIVSAIT